MTPEKRMHDLHMRCWFGLREIGAATRRLRDAEWEDTGKAFDKAFAMTGCAEVISDAQLINASFRSFVYPPNPGERGFVNKMVYGLPAFESGGKLLAARTHEGLHAMQYRTAAVMHADPFNAAAPFFLTPEDYVRRKELLEADAYAKGAWLQSCAARDNPACASALDSTPLAVGEFDKIRRESGSLEETLEKAAAAAGACEGKWLADGSQGPARDLWHALALVEYAEIIKARRAAGEKEFFFVRMADEDAREIGNSFGPNPFQNFLPPLLLSEQNKKTLDELNKTLGIGTGFLPALGEALAQKGLSREAFIAASLSHAAPANAGGKPAALKPREL